MAIFENLLFLTRQLLTFYIPTFFTFRFLMNNNNPKIRTVLKFWCIVTMYHLLQWILSHLIADGIFPVIDIVVLVALNFKEMQYAQMIFDSVVGPAYSKNREAIESVTNNIEKVFNKNTGKLKEKVSDSTTQSIYFLAILNLELKGLVGQILVGTLNPSVKRKDSQDRDNQSKHDDQDQDSDKDD